VIENSRRVERERVLSLLYEAEIKEQSIDQVLQDLPVQPEPFVIETVQGVSASRDRLDQLIQSAAENWATTRMAALDLNILRIATWELLERAELNVAVIISEAVELAKRFGRDDSGRFVNGVLAAVATQVRGV
jgi:transcription antitermination protein NusB